MPINQINTILIANRGEIASRIIRTCKKLGIKTIAVFSDADSHSLFVKEADVAVHIGKNAPSESYLNPDRIFEVAHHHRVNAIHPGYGFLSENAAFAKRCQQEEIIFIGPNAAAIEAMGSKSNAKEMMQRHGVPVIPGYQGADQSLETLKKAANEIGFPLLLKATAGGGGKGMRIVEQAADLEKNIEAAKREALSAFGDDELIIEKYIAKGRHIEFQIFGDQYGKVLHILERECTIQRRYQKILEESPSPALDKSLREKMGEAAVKAAQALKYDSAGTVEFIYDDSTNEFFFLEVNTRLQVEHPVTEEITGLDLVQMQIEVAEGRVLNLEQEAIQGKGYAIEARLYAEDPENDFFPDTGVIQLWEVPKVEGLRIETAVESGSEISIHYDPMIAKIIIWDKHRNTAHRKMAYALKNLKCLGLKTNQDFLLHLFEQQAIQKGNYDTHFIQKHIDLTSFNQKSDYQKTIAAIGLTLAVWHRREGNRGLLRAMPSGWRNNQYANQEISYLFKEEDIQINYLFQGKRKFFFHKGDHTYNIELIEKKDNNIRFSIEGEHIQMCFAQKDKEFFIHSLVTGNMQLTELERFPEKELAKSKGGYTAPMPSQIVKILAKEGQKVKTGDSLLILSSMKMENVIEAEEDGTVEAIFVKEGQSVKAGLLLLSVTS